MSQKRLHDIHVTGAPVDQSLFRVKLISALFHSKAIVEFHLLFVLGGFLIGLGCAQISVSA